MPTPRQGYSLNGKKVPSVTTVIGRYKDASGLFRWIWNCGKDQRDYKLEGRRAADIGTATHDAIERNILNQPQVPNPKEHYDLSDIQMEKARKCYEAWKRWRDLAKPVFHHIEPQLIHSVKYYGGTIDAVGEIDGVPCIMDWKTSNGIYDETALQIAAYSRLWEDNTGEHIDTGYIVRLDKKTGKFEQFRLNDLNGLYEHFCTQLQLFNDAKSLFPAPWEKTTEFRLTKNEKNGLDSKT